MTDRYRDLALLLMQRQQPDTSSPFSLGDRSGQADFLRSEKDTRPHWETDHRSFLVPALMSGYNNSTTSRWDEPSTWYTPIALGGSAFGVLNNILSGRPVAKDEVAHAANDAAGAALTGSIPAPRPSNSLGMFVGGKMTPNLPPARQAALKTAMDREGRGVSPDTIWEGTGWARVPGADPKHAWATEIDDSAWKLRPREEWLKPEPVSFWRRLLGKKPEIREDAAFKNIPLQSILDAPPELYQAMPGLANMRVTGRIDPRFDVSGGFETARNRLTGDTKIYPFKVTAPNEEEFLRTLNHEIQHYAARKSGWPEGANFNEKASQPVGGKPVPYSADTYAATGQKPPNAGPGWDIQRQWMRDEPLSALTPAEAIARDIRGGESDRGVLAKLLRVTRDDYQNNAGEQLANASMNRMRMSPTERRTTMPFGYENAAVTRSVTDKFSEAADEVARREAMNQAMRDRWEKPVDLGDGLTASRMRENQVEFYKDGHYVASANLYPRSGGAGINVAEGALSGLTSDAQSALLKRIHDHTSRSYNVRPEFDDYGAGLEALSVLRQVTPEALVYDPRMYHDAFLAEARRRHGPDANVVYHDVNDPYIDRALRAGEVPTHMDTYLGANPGRKLDQFDDEFFKATVPTQEDRPATAKTAPKMDAQMRDYLNYLHLKREGKLP